MTGSVDVAAFTRFERDGWDNIARGYHRLLGGVTDRAADPLLDAAGVKEGSRVLDVATGPGYVAGRAAARGAQVVGVDLSDGILTLARTLHPQVTFQQAGAADLPFDDASFDALVAGFLVPHLPDPPRVMAECRRVLAPRGVVAVSTWDLPARVAVLGAVVEAVAEVGAPAPAGLPAGPPFFAFSRDGALAGLLRDAGLADIDVSRHTFIHRVASADALWTGVLSGTVRTAALVTTQPPQVQRRIRAAFDRRLSPYEVDGALELPVSVVIGRGRR